MDNKNLSHMRWKCQYHLVFIPKYSILAIPALLGVQVIGSYQGQPKPPLEVAAVSVFALKKQLYGSVK